jgi:hypothetical protein
MDKLILVSISEQRLQLREAESVLMDVAIATAKNGPGERYGSECTPRGWHQIRAKVGAGAELNTVFKGRRNLQPRLAATISGPRLDPDAHSLAVGPGTGQKSPG